jgi:pimeloyl-ACP methyl ester carboxylesterase
MWDPQWRTLAGRHRLIRHDMRGFGRSPAPPGAYWIDGPGRRPEDVDPELRRHAHAMRQWNGPRLSTGCSGTSSADGLERPGDR